MGKVLHIGLDEEILRVTSKEVQLESCMNKYFNLFDVLWIEALGPIDKSNQLC